ncbi:siderophore-interacting protein [Pedobacter westerhofensis]|nr:siderophore-interacting protein [Pedobacter westerhofensis]
METTRFKRQALYLKTTVSAVKDVSPHLRCISLQNDLFKSIGPINPGAHFKLFIPKDASAAAIQPDMSSGRAIWPDMISKPVARTYTVRRINRDSGTLDVEFVMHGDNGPASAWANRAVTGNELGIAIKTGKSFFWSDWYLLAGDETALPAIASMLEAMPADKHGVALLEVGSVADILNIRSMSNITLRWFSRDGNPAEKSELLWNAMKSIKLPDPALGSRCVWIAGENSMVTQLRKYAAEQLRLSREELRATAYWTAGLSEDIR